MMNRVFRFTVSMLALAFFAACLPACNTVKGAGKDLESASENTERAIEKATD